MASKQPRRSILKSDLKFMAQTTYATMFVLTVLTSFWNLTERKKKEEEERTFTITRPVGFAAGKNAECNAGLNLHRGNLKPEMRDGVWN